MRLAVRFSKFLLTVLVATFLLTAQTILSPLIPAYAAMTPFGFWKKQTVCTISSNVTITSANLNSYADCAWALGAATTVTINYTGPIAIKGLTMTSTSTITHTGCNTTACTGAIYLNVTGDVTMTSGARINADGLGYLGSYQTGPDSTQNATNFGLTFNGGTGAGTTAGGSHGGWGGWNSSKTANVPPIPYGITKGPSTYGSGGGGLSAKPGGNGGGVVYMTISGNLTLNGNGTIPAISANGANGTCGAGSGGSVSLYVSGTVTTTTVGPIITANGGTGGTTATCGTGNGSGGGGGGRVYLGYGGLGGTTAITNLQAYGGTGGSSSAYSGGSGTIVTLTGGTNGDLNVYGTNVSTYKINGTPIGVFGRTTSVSSSSVGFTSLYYAYTAGNFVGTNLVPDVDAISISQNPISTTSTTSIGVSSGDLTTLTAVGRVWGIHDTSLDTYDNVSISGGSIVQAGILVVNGLLSIADSSTLMASNLYSTTINMYNTSVISPFPSDTNYYGRLKINATTMTISTSAKVSADGMGYLGGGASGLLGTNSSKYGMSVNFATTGAGSNEDDGGSHGSSGGYWADPSVKLMWPGVVYDSISQPTEPGGGGGTGLISNVAGNGGGVVIINLSGTLTVDGKITSKGGTGGGSGLSGGGGAGGSIYVSANTITSSSATTIFDASGGTATNNGGGAGGRISLSYTTLGGTMAISQAKITAAGGAGFDSGCYGGSGSVFTFPTGSTYGNYYLLDNTTSNFRLGPLSPYGFVTSSTATTITDNGLPTYARDFYFTKAQVVGKVIAVGAEDSSTTDFTITDYNSATGVFTVSGGSAAGLTVGKMWYIKGFNTHYDNMHIYGDGRFEAHYLNVSGSFKGYAGSDAYIRIAKMDVATLDLTNGNISLDAFQSTGPIPPKPLIINATTATIGSNSYIDVTGSGYQGGYCTWNVLSGREGWCNNSGNAGYTYGNTTTGGSSMYSGGSHGGYGGVNSSNTPATPFGDALAPITFGSGGGGNSAVGANGWGGPGGGVVIMNVSGTLTVNGFIQAAGWPTQNGAGGSSGGAGGSIYVTAGTITTNAGNDKFAAWGGWMDSGAESASCGGGGGRVAIYYTNSSGSFGSSQLTTYGGFGVASNGCNGNGGTEYIKKASDSGGTLTVWNSNRVPNYLPTPLPPTNLTLKALYIQESATAKMMSNTYTYNFGTTGTLTVEASTTLYIPNDQSNVGPYNNAVPVGTWFTVPTGRKTGNITEY